MPVERLWAGISNCSGQMALPPIAAIFPGSPERAYRETFAVDFIDANDHEPALPLLEEVVKKNPNDTVAQYHLNAQRQRLQAPHIKDNRNIGPN